MSPDLAAMVCSTQVRQTASLPKTEKVVHVVQMGITTTGTSVVPTGTKPNCSLFCGSLSLMHAQLLLLIGDMFNRSMTVGMIPTTHLSTAPATMWPTMLHTRAHEHIDKMFLCMVNSVHAALSSLPEWMHQQAATHGDLLCNAMSLRCIV